MSLAPCDRPTKTFHVFAGALCKGGQRGDCSAKNRAGMTTLPSALFNRLPRSRRRKERRRQRSRFLPTMAKTSVRRARTPHRGDAHNARLTPLHRGGKEQPRGRGWRAGAYAFCCCFVIPNFLSVIPNFLSVIPNECEGSPCKRQGAGGIPRFANFAPMGLVRRFVEMLLQAGISPRVGRNDGV